MTVNLTNPIFHNEDAARAHLESVRWPNGPVCPHCGEIDNAYKLAGKTTRKGLYKCAGCRKTFTVKMQSIFEDSQIMTIGDRRSHFARRHASGSACRSSLRLWVSSAGGIPGSHLFRENWLG